MSIKIKKHTHIVAEQILKHNRHGPNRVSRIYYNFNDVATVYNTYMYAESLLALLHVLAINLSWCFQTDFMGL